MHTYVFGTAEHFHYMATWTTAAVDSASLILTDGFCDYVSFIIGHWDNLFERKN